MVYRLYSTAKALSAQHSSRSEAHVKVLPFFFGSLDTASPSSCRFQNLAYLQERRSTLALPRQLETRGICDFLLLIGDKRRE